MDIVGEIISLLAVVFCTGLAARTFSDFMQINSWVDRKHEEVCKSDPDSLMCEWLGCSFCQTGWAAGLLVPWFCVALGVPLLYSPLLWAAAWRVGTSLPEIFE